MGSIIIVILWGEAAAVVGALYSSISRMYYAEGFGNTIFQGIFGLIWGAFCGFFIGEVIFFTLLFTIIGCVYLKDRLVDLIRSKK
jgi:Ca2+-dependent lipid-binding protein